jgi:hypothetical protein
MRFFILWFFVCSLTCVKAQRRTKGGCNDTVIKYRFVTSKVFYPKTAVDANIQGAVTIKFDIDSTCAIVNRSVVKGLGYGCDEEAIKSFDEVEKKLKEEHKSKCCPLKDVETNVKFRLE